MSREIYVGLMSGTSADSIDAVAVDFSKPTPSLIACHEQPLSDALKASITELCQSSDHEIERQGKLDRELGLAFASAVNKLLKDAKLAASDITAIGSHGQTVRHRPPTESRSTHSAFTLQIGDPNTIAFHTGISTVADFRRRDIAAGGQGAPLVPAFHHNVFRHPERSRAIINIGGMANITVLKQDGSVTGFDTGPGNILLDSWIHYQQGKSYDANGDWAASGASQPGLLKYLMEHPFFHLAPPKSTGREDFNLDWLRDVIAEYPQPLAVEDIQATLVELTAHSIADVIVHLGCPIDEVFICGGGAFNGLLMATLEALLHPRVVASTISLGIPPQWVEACAFAWLAKQTLAGLPGNCPAVTGASREVVLGAIYPA
ncbi:MAG: anhydro-N-acetylmuramic acid kinase [Pseudomonadales bacterium]